MIDSTTGKKCNNNLIFPPKKVLELEVNFSPKLCRTMELKGTIQDYLFVYEFGGQQRSWDEEIIVHHWTKAKTVYLVWQGKEQFDVAKHLFTPHGQLFVDDVLEALENIEKPLKTKFVLVGEEGEIDDENLFVRNKQNKDILYDRDEIDYVINIEKEKKKKENRQSTYFDLGFTSTRCSVRRTGYCNFRFSNTKNVFVDKQNAGAKNI